MLTAFFFLLFLCVSVIYLYIITKRGVTDVFINPVLLGGLFFSLIHIIMPYLQWKNDYYRYSNAYSDSTIFMSVFLLVVAQILFSFLYVFTGPKISSNETNIIYVDRRYSKTIFKSSIVVFLIGLYFAYKNLALILSMGIEAYLSDRIGFGTGSGLSLLLAHWLYVACILFYFISRLPNVSGKFLLIVRIMFVVSLLATIIYYTVNSNRNSIFILFLNLITIKLVINPNAAINKKSHFKTGIGLLLAFIIAISLFYAIGKIRSTQFSTSNNDSYGIVKNLNGAFGNHENILWLVENKFNFQVGATYLAGLTNFIPRSLWNDKPVGAGPILKNMIYPGSYVVGRKGNSSLTSGLYTELLMNFGILGSGVFICFIGFFFGLLFRFLNKSKKPMSKLICIIVTIFLSTQFYYAEFLGFFTRLVITIFPLTLINLISYETNSPKHGKWRNFPRNCTVSSS